MKKILSFALMTALAASMGLMPVAASAQTNPNLSLIQSYLETIKKLNDQITALQTQLNQIQKQKTELQVQGQATVAKLVQSLKQGDQGENVKTLQALLAADPEMYPEGLITGFYGGLTVKAVARFQKKNGIDSIGIVGPKTLKKLNELLEDHPLAFEKIASLSSGSSNDDDDDDDDNKGKRPCAIIPPGHLIAPGWLKKHNGERPIVPPCQILPPGIDKKIDHPTSTTDTTAPVISAILASVTNNSATITWTTNETANSQIFYGTSTAYGSNTTLDTLLVTSHSQAISGLSANTVYHFQVKSKDAAGNMAASADQTFTTSGIADTTAPVISAIAVSNVSSTSAMVGWTTDEVSDSQIEYGTSTSYGLMTSLNTSLVTSHNQNLTGLMPNTMYHFRVKSKDASNNLATSADQTFTTTVAPDTTAPVISSISVTNTSSTSATVNWTTDEAASSKVYYSTVNPVNTASSSVQSSATLVTSHILNLSGLATSTTYFFLIESTDAAANTALSTQQSLTTTP